MVGNLLFLKTVIHSSRDQFVWAGWLEVACLGQSSSGDSIGLHVTTQALRGLALIHDGSQGLALAPRNDGIP